MSRVAPIAMLPGNWVAGGPTRATMPVSWSVLISSGMCDGSAAAACCKPLDSPAIWSGLFALLVQLK